MQDQQE